MGPLARKHGRGDPLNKKKKGPPRKKKEGKNSIEQRKKMNAWKCPEMSGLEDTRNALLSWESKKALGEIIARKKESQLAGRNRHTGTEALVAKGNRVFIGKEIESRAKGPHWRRGAGSRPWHPKN